MLNYINSEIFRGKKSKTIKGLLIAGIVIPVLLFIFIVVISSEVTQDNNNIYFQFIIPTLIPAGSIIGMVLIVFVKKKEDLIKLILSHGMSKENLIIYDYITFQFMTLVLSLFMFLITLILNFILSKIIGYNPVADLSYFIQSFFMTYVIQFILNNILFFFSYTLDTVFGNILYFLTITILIPLLFINDFRVFNNDYVNKVSEIIISIATQGELAGIDLKFVIYSILISITSVILTIIWFNKKEL